MICRRCHRHLRNSAVGLRCTNCESSYHIKCLSNADKNVSEAGDRNRLPWKCAICQTVASYDFTAVSKEDLYNAINALSEKFELVNKIQLPKLNGELAQLKCLSDHISKQNEDILRKFAEMEKKASQEKRPSASTSGSKATRTHRKRSLNLTHHRQKGSSKSKANENNEYVPMISSEKSVRYRMRRRSYSYVLSRMLHLVNRKLNRDKKTHKKRHRGAVHLGFSSTEV